MDKSVTRASTLDLLHDMLYNTDLWNANKREDDATRRKTAEKIGEWRGSLTVPQKPLEQPEEGGAEGGGSSSNAQEDKPAVPAPGSEEAAAEMYLDFIRQLEAFKTPHLQQLAVLLGMQRVQTGGQTMGIRLNNVVQSLPRKSSAPMIALYLTCLLYTSPSPRD